MEKAIYQQYRAYFVCIDVQAGLGCILVARANIITLSFSKLSYLRVFIQPRLEI
jgi:hypothetical protein